MRSERSPGQSEESLGHESLRSESPADVMMAAVAVHYGPFVTEKVIVEDQLLVTKCTTRSSDVREFLRRLQSIYWEFKDLRSDF